MHQFGDPFLVARELRLNKLLCDSVYMVCDGHRPEGKDAILRIVKYLIDRLTFGPHWLTHQHKRDMVRRRRIVTDRLQKIFKRRLSAACLECK